MKNAYWHLTLIPPKSKVISPCHQYRARPACTSVKSDQALYCCLTNFQVLILIPLNMIKDGSKNVRWIIPFKKFGLISSGLYNRSQGVVVLYYYKYPVIQLVYCYNVDHTTPHNTTHVHLSWQYVFRSENF